MLNTDKFRLKATNTDKIFHSYGIKTHDNLFTKKIIERSSVLKYILRGN